MRLGHLELFCADTSRTRDFFVKALGFEINEEQPGGFVWLLSGSAEVLLRPGTPLQSPGIDYQSSGQAIVIYTEDLYGARKRIEDAGTPMLGTDGSPDCLTFQGPDGHWFQLVQHP